MYIHPTIFLLVNVRGCKCVRTYALILEFHAIYVFSVSRLLCCHVIICNRIHPVAASLMFAAGKLSETIFSSLS